MKIVICGAGPVGALAAIYAARRGHEVEIYELRGGMIAQSFVCFLLYPRAIKMLRHVILHETD